MLLVKLQVSSKEAGELSGEEAETGAAIEDSDSDDDDVQVSSSSRLLLSSKCNLNQAAY